MTRTEARRYVARMAAQSLRCDLDNGSEWIFAADGRGLMRHEDYEPRNEADIARIRDAIERLADELERRAGDQ